MYSCFHLINYHLERLNLKMNVLEYSMPRMNYGYPQPRPSNPTRNGGIFTSGETRDTKTSCSKEIMYLHLRVSDRLDGWKFELGKSFYLQPSIYLSFCQISRPDLETLIRLFQPKIFQLAAAEMKSSYLKRKHCLSKILI